MDVDEASPSSSQSPPSNSTTNKPSTTFTPSQRITDLNEIDTSISTLLSSASTAISVLSQQDLSDSSPAPSSTLQSAKSTFTTAASTYFSTLSSIEVRLRRQVYALEEAGLISAGTEQDARRGRNLNNSNEETMRAGGGGGGPLDPSWLNARSSAGVEMGKKRELLDEARRFIEDLQSKSSKAQSKEISDAEMDEEEKGT